MINKLYSILVSGCYTIPEDCQMYRKYTKLTVKPSGIPTYKDPYRRAMWANSIIELAKTSILYPIIEDLDKSNTYRVAASRYDYMYKGTNAEISKWSDISPVIHIEGDVIDGVATYTYNNSGPIMADIPKNKSIDVLGYTINIITDNGPFSVHASTPAVVIDIPELSVIQSNVKHVSDVIQDVDINDPWDRAALFCIYLLRSYNG